MKTRKIINAFTAVVVLLIMAACNKGEDDFLYKGDILPVTIKGYNGSNEQLEVKIDTSKFKHLLGGNSTINLNDAYTFQANKTTATLKVTEKSTGKLVIEKELKKGEKNVVVNIVYINGKVIPFDPPAADPNTNKVGLFILNNENSNLADIKIIDFNLTVLASLNTNISPNQWSYFDVGYTTSNPSNLITMFYKAGANTGYFKNDLFQSYLNGIPLFPVNGTKGVVRSFLILYDAGRRSTTAIQIQ